MNAKIAVDRPLTGRKVLAIAVTFFGIIILVNMFMAFSAVRTFPGLEVKNSYVASQQFDARARAQRALGWDVSASIVPGGVQLVIRDEAGALVTPVLLDARIGHPTNAAHDQVLGFSETAEGLFAPALLANGPWRLFLLATAADGTEYSSRLQLIVR